MFNVLSEKIKKNIQESSLTIFDEVEPGDIYYWYPSEELELVLNEYMVGKSVIGLANRTRSKVLKTWVCEALGYPVPKSFKKTQPRFLCQNFDVYGQKSSNLQVWNEGISPTRRYVLIKISEQDIIKKIKVVNGDQIEKLDKTGKLTQKFQANYTIPHFEPTLLLSEEDTENFKNMSKSFNGILDHSNPSGHPKEHSLMPINIVYEKLKNIVNDKLIYLGHGQERNNGAALHRLVCEKLGYSSYHDDGKFPDVKNQLIEVKLQTSQTIDLGLFLPSATDVLDIPKINNLNFRMCDVRYAIFYGSVKGNLVEINNFYLVTGQNFFNYFRQFEGMKINKKIQMTIPDSFW
ncbi:restriction endonuclease [Listeria seeligeri]|uniref:restriction endonuclease n=1 Tax=Listeria seeligeri TaxID=1640 RepID=UPI0016251716|nr:restriction endonuclease [Listeria seeligeri]MBC1728201.1 restriction endonuclease [Listeria seeligeri]MBC1756384.1 restriction endonuclease [Listeria seeligeri]MBC1815152.1 restriction endonuclease [Listeria seeligeri]MBC1831221.1 restriction endonuclease [Listeria seeligeri]MBC1849212.1 restriction endonuclease [Listeria seeligeri]